jgi:hypothetical protein
MTLTEIKEEIPLLTLAEKLRLMRWLATDVEAEGSNEDTIDEAEIAAEERWHEQLREDFRTGGPMSKLAAKAREEHRRGKTLPGWP